MATIQKYVNTASTAGGDGTTNGTAGGTRAYASLSEWEANTETGVGTDNFIVDCCGTAADTTQVVVNFATNISGAGSITIQANASDPAGKYNGTALISSSHYRLTDTADFYMLRVQEINVTIDGIQIEYGSSNASSIAINLEQSSAGTQLVQNCRVRSSSGATAIGIGNTGNLGGGTRTVQNNLIVNFIDGIKLLIANSSSPTHNVYHNTIYGRGGVTSGNGINMNRGGVSSNPTLNVKGNAVANTFTTDITVSGSLGTYNTADNATEDTTGEIQSIVAADAWTSPGTTAAADFSVKDTSSSLYDAVNPTLLTEDIIEFTRDGSNHDVGAFELQTGGSLGAGAESSYFPGGGQPQTSPITISKW
jgi:hypothetical protein